MVVKFEFTPLSAKMFPLKRVFLNPSAQIDGGTTFSASPLFASPLIDQNDLLSFDGYQKSDSLVPEKKSIRVSASQKDGKKQVALKCTEISFFHVLLSR